MCGGAVSICTDEMVFMFGTDGAFCTERSGACHSTAKTLGLTCIVSFSRCAAEGLIAVTAYSFAACLKPPVELATSLFFFMAALVSLGRATLEDSRVDLRVLPSSLSGFSCKWGRMELSHVQTRSRAMISPRCRACNRLLLLLPVPELLSGSNEG